MATIQYSYRSLGLRMTIVADFRDGILFVPEVLLAANAMKGGMAILKPLPQRPEHLVLENGNWNRQR